MDFEWDSGKREANLHKHGLAFEDARAIFAGLVITDRDRRKDYGEARFRSLGVLEGRIILVVHAVRADKVRIISMRKANEKERRAYQKRFEKTGFDVGPRH